MTDTIGWILARALLLSAAIVWTLLTLENIARYTSPRFTDKAEVKYLVLAAICWGLWYAGHSYAR